MFILYSYHLLIFIDFKINLFRKKICPAFLDVYFYVRGSFSSSGRYGQCCNELAYCSCNETISLLFDKMLKQKKNLLNKRLKYELTCSSMRKIQTGHEFNQPDGETDGQGDSYVVYTHKLCQGRNNNTIVLHNWVILKRSLLITEIIRK